MAKFRKKPVVVEAWRWLYESSQEVEPSWVSDALGKWPHAGGLKFDPNYHEGPRMWVATLEGVMIVTPGDWIIKGIEGELYSCKNAIFEASYQPVDENGS